jgi:hypothetical protein
MKRLLLTMTVMMLFLSGMVFADQVIAKFETDLCGYSINGCGTGLTRLSSRRSGCRQTDNALKMTFTAQRRNGFEQIQSIPAMLCVDLWVSLRPIFRIPLPSRSGD